jgi:hypothetical protein
VHSAWEVFTVQMDSLDLVDSLKRIVRDLDFDSNGVVKTESKSDSSSNENKTNSNKNEKNTKHSLSNRNTDSTAQTNSSIF